MSKSELDLQGIESPDESPETLYREGAFLHLRDLAVKQAAEIERLKAQQAKLAAFGAEVLALMVDCPHAQWSRDTMGSIYWAAKDRGLGITENHVFKALPDGPEDPS